MGPNPDDPTKPHQIRLCKTFARALYGADLDGPTTAFDACGLWVSGTYLDNDTYAWGNGDLTVVIPSKNPNW